MVEVRTSQYGALDRVTFNCSAEIANVSVALLVLRGVVMGTRAGRPRRRRGIGRGGEICRNQAFRLYPRPTSEKLTTLFHRFGAAADGVLSVEIAKSCLN